MANAQRIRTNTQTHTHTKMRKIPRTPISKRYEWNGAGPNVSLPFGFWTIQFSVYWYMGGSNAKAAAECSKSFHTFTRTERTDNRAIHIWHSMIKFIRETIGLAMRQVGFIRQFPFPKSRNAFPLIENWMKSNYFITIANKNAPKRAEIVQ